MSATDTLDASARARTFYQVSATRVSEVICHRRRNGREQYLIKWKKTSRAILGSSRAICSWHELSELQESLRHVQSYIDSLRQTPRNPTTEFLSLNQVGRKRKFGSEDPTARETYGLPSLIYSSQFRRFPSPLSTSQSSAEASPPDEPTVYNGVLQHKEGKIVARESRDPGVVSVTHVLTPQMAEVAASTPVTQAIAAIRNAFMHKLRKVRGVAIENNVDDSTPSLDFKFIADFVLQAGIYRAPPESNEGCGYPCRPNMGQNIGCQSPTLCHCLDYAAVNLDALQRDTPDLYANYLQLELRGEPIDKKGLPKCFPYHAPKSDPRYPRTLRSFYLDSRHPIYECNVNCNCGPACKNRLVQHGRKVPLTIFKTADRGWGVKCDEDLIEGEFIDTYLGEVITNQEADSREAKAGKDKHSYFYSLDKFIGDDDELTEENCYVVDGQHMGGPTRFINHSCEPNCRQYTVSYNKHDLRIYELAFFACEDIPAGTELTFDYMDKNEEEEEMVVRKREEAARDPANEDKQPCNCGARKCRGFLWV